MEYRIRDLSINYEVIGSGKPVVMLHGYTLDHRMMMSCMEPVFNLKNGYKRIYIDLPGMGKSSSADWIINADEMLGILISFIGEVIPNENFLLAGESYGGYLSRGIVYKMPERVDGVLLICPVIKTDSRKRNVPPHAIIIKDDKLLSDLPLEEAEEFNSLAVMQNKTIYGRYKDEIMAAMKIADMKFLDDFQKNGYEFSFDPDKTDKKFSKPSLMIMGRQDSCVGYEDAWTILEHYPRASFAVLDGAGHNLQIEQDMLFNSLVSEWIRRVENQ